MELAKQALASLKRGQTLNCTTPDGVSFQIQPKLSYGLAWYRVRPARRGCLNRYSRLSDIEMLRWLSSLKGVTVR